MLMEEFEERTGFHVPGEFFDVIHEVYMETDMDKDKFCNAYKKNTIYPKEDKRAGFHM